MTMKCPHCDKEINLGPTLWAIWYREDIRKRIIAQTGSESLADLVCRGAVQKAVKAIEEFVGALCLAWHRGRDQQIVGGDNDDEDDEDDDADDEEEEDEDDNCCAQFWKA